MDWRARRHKMPAFYLILKTLALLVCVHSSSIHASDSQNMCTIKGRVFTQRKWYGYLLYKSFQQDFAKIQYQITYPVKECCANLLIYYDDQVNQLKPTMTCETRENILPDDNNQVIPLGGGADGNGCSVWNETGEPFYVCLGERIFRSSVRRTWFFAVSRCHNEGLLNLNYVFNITGFYGACEDDPVDPTSDYHLSRTRPGHAESNDSKDVYFYLSIVFGIIAGLALILSAVRVLLQ